MCVREIARFLYVLYTTIQPLFSFLVLDLLIKENFISPSPSPSSKGFQRICGVHIRAGSLELWQQLMQLVCIEIGAIKPPTVVCTVLFETGKPYCIEIRPSSSPS